ncbi:hypothetical protein [Adlercreutzia sp. ZJ154]|uniref:hypothetical protein n=1 Tax=Adlercreutzia sp. ZJ154 TaxID=2709790 RepID=UPI0013EA570C|nr:hypothetical protein [Adlercreutzia sp. ZJ154]
MSGAQEKRKIDWAYAGVSNTNKCFTILVAVFPIVSIYSAGIQQLSVGDFLLAITFVLMLVKRRKSLKESELTRGVLSLRAFGAYIIVTFLFQLILSTNVGVLSTLRYCLYIFAVVLFYRKCDFEFGIKILGGLTMAISLYVVVQYFYFKALGSILPWRIPFLGVVDDAFVLKEQGAFYHQYYRPTGIFYEPTHYAQYCLIYFSYLLFCEKKIQKKWAKVLLIVAGIVCSGSSAGLFIVCAAFAIYFISKPTANKKSIDYLILLSVVSVGCFVLLSDSSLAGIWTKLVGTDGEMSASVGYRFNSANDFLSDERGLLAFLFGTGRGSSSAYYTAFFYVLFSHGVIGLLFFLRIFLSSFTSLKTVFQRATVILVLIISFGSEMVVNFGILTYFIFIFSYPSIFEGREEIRGLIEK